MRWWLLILLAVVAVAQQGSRRTSLGVLQNLVGIATVFPSLSSSDSSVWVIGYRLNASDLLYVQRQYPQQEFVANYVVTIELRDTLGVVRYARVFTDSVVMRTEPKRWADVPASNVDVVVLANGTYTMSVDVTQQQRQRMVWQATVTVDGSAQSMAAASLCFVGGAERAEVRCLQPWGKVVPFGTRRATAMLVVPRHWSGRDRLQMQCRLLAQYYPFYRGADTVVSLPIRLDDAALFALPQCSREPDVFTARVCCTMAAIDHYRILTAELDLRRAIPGDYELLIIRPATRDTLRTQFRVQWFAAPPHLLVSRYAVEVMQYVLPDADYSALLDEADSNRTAAIIRWWKSQDPTPATAYNEAMVEYFARALDARTRFATAQEPDGALTERGKIYILFGPPTRVETELEPGKAGREIWYYTNRVQKRFVFEVTEQGRYRLVSITSL